MQNHDLLAEHGVAHKIEEAEKPGPKKDSSLVAQEILASGTDGQSLHDVIFRRTQLQPFSILGSPHSGLKFQGGKV